MSSSAGQMAPESAARGMPMKMQTAPPPPSLPSHMQKIAASYPFLKNHPREGGREGLGMVSFSALRLQGKHQKGLIIPRHHLEALKRRAPPVPRLPSGNPQSQWPCYETCVLLMSRLAKHMQATDFTATVLACVTASCLSPLIF